jgi:amino acid transporter
MPKNSKIGFGTFGGVFVPNILTILGVIMYLRTGWVVGNAGLKNSLIIVLIANLITFLTALSISTISTNMKVKGGGVYYIISRSLGLEAGGCIGIPLYIAQALGIGLYLAGFTEAVVNLFPTLNPKIIGIATLTILTVLAIISSGIVIKIQYIVLGVIGLSLVSFFTGRLPDFNSVQLSASYETGYNFWSVFAIFFPAVTGILSGVSLSGDLKDASKSIPRGTLYSVLVGSIIYLLISIWFSGMSSPEELKTNNSIMISSARWAPLIYAGIWGATLSSALASLLAAPRTMQALAIDRVLFKILGKGKGQQNEPILATLFTFLLVGGILYVGDLDTIAPVLTMFFLITYGSVNFIALIERLASRPGFRPSFKVHWIFSLIGAISCTWVMFIINIYACIGGVIFVVSLYVILKKRQTKRDWGDSRIGIWSAIIRYSLLKLENKKFHPKNWRPTILLFNRRGDSNQNLLQIAGLLTRKSGYVTSIHLYLPDEIAYSDLEKDHIDIRELIISKNLTVFRRNIVVNEITQGMIVAAQTNGIGKIKHNTIIMDWPDIERENFVNKYVEIKSQFKLIRVYKNLNISTILMKCNSEELNPSLSQIDVWWDPHQDNGSFMLLLAHLFRLGKRGSSSRITLKTVVLEEKTKDTRQLLEELIKKSRIEADIHVLFPEDSERKNYEISYNRIIKAKKVKTNLFNFFGKANDNPKKQIESVTENDAKTTQKELKKNDDDAIDEDEERIKEEISSQVEERDAYIIQKNIQKLIVQNSQSADLVLLGYNIPKEEKEQKYIKKMNELVNQLPNTILINCPFEVNLFE